MSVAISSCRVIARSISFSLRMLCVGCCRPQRQGFETKRQHVFQTATDFALHFSSFGCPAVHLPISLHPWLLTTIAVSFPISPGDDKKSPSLCTKIRTDTYHQRVAHAHTNKNSVCTHHYTDAWLFSSKKRLHVISCESALEWDGSRLLIYNSLGILTFSRGWTWYYFLSKELGSFKTSDFSLFFSISPVSLSKGNS